MPGYRVSTRIFPSRTFTTLDPFGWSVAFIKKYKPNFVTGPKEKPLTTVFSLKTVLNLFYGGWEEGK